MNLTPKANTIKSLFSTKKSSGYETRSKRKLATISPVESKPLTFFSLTPEVKKGRSENKGKQNVTPKTNKLINQAGQSKITQFLSSVEPLSSPQIVSKSPQINPNGFSDDKSCFVSLPTFDDCSTDSFQFSQDSLKPTFDTNSLLSSPFKKENKSPALPCLIQPGPRVIERPAFSKLNSSIPGHLRFASASKNGSLPLPSHFESLEKNLKCLLYTMIFTQAIKNSFVFHHLQSAVETSSKRSFPVSQLLQFKTLLPDYFEFEPIKIEINFTQVESWLIKVPSLGLGAASSDNQTSISLVPISRTEKIENICQELRKKLLDLVFCTHNDFLASRGMLPSKTLPSRWHPLFKLENVPIVKETPLVEQTVNCDSKTNDTFVNRVEAFKAQSTNTASNSNVTLPNLQPTIAPSKPLGILDRARELLARSKLNQSTSTTLHDVKGIDVSAYSIQQRREEAQRKMEDLIKAVKAKEDIRLADLEKNPNPEEKIETRLKLSQLKGLVRSIKAIFSTAQGRNTLPLDQVVNQVSSKQVWQLSPEEIHQLIRFLIKVLPNYVKLEYFPRLKIHHVTLLNPNLSLTEIEVQIENYKKEHGY